MARGARGRAPARRLRSTVRLAARTPSPERPEEPVPPRSPTPPMVTIPEEHYQTLLDRIQDIAKSVTDLRRRDEARSRAEIPRPDRRSPTPMSRRPSTPSSLPPRAQRSSRRACQSEREGQPAGKRPRRPCVSSSDSTPSHGRCREVAPNDQNEERFREMEEKIAQLIKEKSGDGATGGRTQHPFSERVMAEAVPRHFKVPPIEPYDGSADPLDHLGAYKAHLMVQGASDSLYCLAFPATLKKAARMWFSNLRPGTVNSFADLEKQFLIHFRTSQHVPRNSDSLFLVQQKSDETLRSYLARFNAAATEIPDLNEHVAMSALKIGLKPSRLTFSLDKSSPKDYAALLEKVHRYAQAEEQAASRRQTDTKPAKKGGKAPDAHPRTDGRAAGRPTQGPREYKGRFDTYTPLTAPRERVLMEIQNDNLLARPPPMKRPPEKRARDKYCLYHRDHGHTTEECFQLKDAIENLIKQGYLARYVRRQPPQAAEPVQLNPPADGELPNQRPAGRGVGVIQCQAPEVHDSGRETSRHRPADGVVGSQSCWQSHGMY